MPEPPEQNKADTYAQAATDISNTALRGMAPAEKGWILAAVVMILGALGLIEITNYLDNKNGDESTAKFFTLLETSRSEENRRLQEQNKTLADALARQSDRLGRQAIESTRNKEIQGVVKDFQPKGE